MPVQKTFQEILEDIKDKQFKPFSHNDKCLEDYGFHIFIGREVFDDGQEHNVTLDSLGSVAYDGMHNAVDDLARAVRTGRKVLLSKSPGRWECPKGTAPLEPRTYMPFDDDQMKELRKQFEAIPDMGSYKSPFDYQPLLS